MFDKGNKGNTITAAAVMQFLTGGAKQLERLWGTIQVGKTRVRLIG